MTLYVVIRLQPESWPHDQTAVRKFTLRFSWLDYVGRKLSWRAEWFVPLFGLLCFQRTHLDNWAICVELGQGAFVFILFIYNIGNKQKNPLIAVWSINNNWLQLQWITPLSQSFVQWIWLCNCKIWYLLWSLWFSKVNFDNHIFVMGSSAKNISLAHLQKQIDQIFEFLKIRNRREMLG